MAKLPDYRRGAKREGSRSARPLTEEERGLLDACAAWHSGGKPLEEDERVRAYIEQDPTHLKVVRAVEQLLAAGKFLGLKRETAAGHGR